MTFYDIGMMPRAEQADVDETYEHQTEELYDDMCKDYENGHYEAYADLDEAVKKLKQCIKWIDEALNEEIDKTLEARIASYYDSADELRSFLEYDLEKWRKESELERWRKE